MNTVLAAAVFPGSIKKSKGSTAATFPFVEGVQLRARCRNFACTWWLEAFAKVVPGGEEGGACV